MTCEEFSEFIVAYRDDELGAGERRDFEAHLAVCPECVEYLRGYEETVRLGKAVMGRRDEAVPDDMPEALVQAILRARRQRRD